MRVPDYHIDGNKYCYHHEIGPKSGKVDREKVSADRSEGATRK